MGQETSCWSWCLELGEGPSGEGMRLDMINIDQPWKLVDMISDIESSYLICESTVKPWWNHENSWHPGHDDKPCDFGWFWAGWTRVRWGSADELFSGKGDPISPGNVNGMSRKHALNKAQDDRFSWAKKKLTSFGHNQGCGDFWSILELQDFLMHVSYLMTLHTVVMTKNIQILQTFV
jgi:hypothetical protein